MPNGSLRVKHREYFGDLFSYLGAFLDRPVDQQTYFRLEISPANSALFPWLSTVASRFETYSFNSLKFCYVPYCSTSTPGSVLLAVDYDPSDLRPLTKADLMAMEESVRSTAWSEVQHVCRADNLRKHGRDKYTDLTYNGTGNSFQGGAVDPSGPAASLRQQFVGSFYATAPNGTGINGIGELYVEYDVVFSTPQLTKEPVPAASIRTVETNLSDWFLYTSALSYESNLMFDVPTTNTIRLNVNLDWALLFLKSEKSAGGIISPPFVSANTGGQSRGLLVNAVNAAGTLALRVEVWTFSIGTVLTLNTGAGGPYDTLSVNISQTSPFFGSRYGAPFS